MIRAYIREDFVGMYLSIALIREAEGAPRQILRIEDPGSATVVHWENLPDEPRPDIAPTFQIGDSEARALLEALVRHYDGASDVRALRRDYDAERKRVDDLTGALVEVTRRLAEPAPAEATQYHAHFDGMARSDVEAQVRAALPTDRGPR